jgi:predicted porin
MKKKLLAVALAGAVAAPMAANAGVYASIRADLEFTDVAGNSDVGIGDHSSRLGIKNALDLGNGLKAVGRFEWNGDANGTEAIYNGRLGYVGLGGSFGEIQVGQLWGGSYLATGDWDAMNATGYNTGLHPIFRCTGLAYEKGFGPVNFRGATCLEPEGVDATTGLPTNEDTVDKVDLGLTYSGPVKVGLGFATDNNADNDTLMLSVGGSIGAFGGTIGYQDDDAAGSAVQLYAFYGMGNNTFHAQIEDSSDQDISSVAIGWQYKFNSQTRVAVEYENVDIGAPDDNSGLHVFMRYDFD